MHEETVRRRMNYNCGCGFKTTMLTEANEHVSSTGHSIHIFGEIRSPVKKKSLHQYAREEVR